MVTENEIFLQNFLYPFFLLITGGAMSGILIPWYTNRQKVKQEEIENLRKDREIDLERERQDYNFKILLKKELIESFQTFKANTMSKLTPFHIQLFNHFATEPIEWFTEGRRAALEIPDTKGKYPKEIFGKIWKELEENIHYSMDTEGNSFLVKLSWYSDNDELMEKFEEIKSKLGEYSIVLGNVVNTKDDEQFNDGIGTSYEKNRELKTEFNDLREKIVKLQIGDVPV